MAPARNDEFELHDVSCSVSDIQDYINYIIKKHETLPINPPIHIYINRINHSLIFKIKHEYKIKLQTLETMKLFGSTQKLTDKPKNGENVLSLEVVELV